MATNFELAGLMEEALWQANKNKPRTEPQKIAPQNPAPITLGDFIASGFSHNAAQKKANAQFEKDPYFINSPLKRAGIGLTKGLADFYGGAAALAEEHLIPLINDNYKPQYDENGKFIAQNTISQNAKKIRDYEAEANAAFKKAKNGEWDVAGGIGEVAGAIANPTLLIPGSAPTLAGRMALGAAAGAADMGVRGYGIDPQKDALKDTAIGAAAGAAGVALIEGAIKAGGKIYSKLRGEGKTASEANEKAREVATEFGKNEVKEGRASQNDYSELIKALDENEKLNSEINGVKTAAKMSEAEYKSEQKRVGEVLRAARNTQTQNEATGIIATISKDGARKMVSNAAVQKSVKNGFSAAEHFAASEQVLDLFKKAKPLLSQRDIKNGDPNVEISRSIADISDNAAAGIMVKKTKISDKNSIYTIELRGLLNKINSENGDIATSFNNTLSSQDPRAVTKAVSGDIIPQNALDIDNEVATALQKNSGDIEAARNELRNMAASAIDDNALAINRAISNGGLGEVDPLLGGFNAVKALDDIIKSGNFTEAKIAARLDEAGFNAEAKTAFLSSYKAGDSNIYKDYLNGKIAAAAPQNKVATELEPLKNGDYKFIDKEGAERILKKSDVELWQKTFNLKSIDGIYTPNLPKEVSEAIGDINIKLTKGSLLKIASKGRAKYIAQIKSTLSEPDYIIKDNGALIFAKKDGDKTYFASVAKEFEGDFIVVSNAPKKQNNIFNKLKNNEVLYTRGGLSPFNTAAEAIKVVASADIIPKKQPKQTLKELKELQKEVRALNEKYDLDEFLARRENISAADRDRPHGGWRRQMVYDDTAVGDQPRYIWISGQKGVAYNQWAATTKSDVARFRAGKWDKDLIAKIKSDLDDLNGDDPLTAGHTDLKRANNGYMDGELERLIEKYGKKPDKSKSELKELELRYPKDRDEYFAPYYIDKNQNIYNIDGYMEENPFLSPKNKKESITDNYGNKIEIDSELANEWRAHFGDDLSMPYEAKIPQKISDFIGGEKVFLEVGSLIKIDKKSRNKYVGKIKETLESPEAVIKQNDGALIFVKNYGETKLFTSIARNGDGRWTIRSNAPKSINGLKNKIKNGGKLIYGDIKRLFDTQINANVTHGGAAQSSTAKAPSDIIPQSADFAPRKFNKIAADKETAKLYESVYRGDKIIKKELEEGISGYYDVKSGEIVINKNLSGADLAHAILHETIHARTIGVLRAARSGDGLSKNELAAAKNIKKIYQKIKDKGDYYGLTNAEEMIAELSNPEFRAFLRGQKVGNKNLLMATYEAVLNAVKRLFNKDDLSALEKSLKELMSDSSGNGVGAKAFLTKADKEKRGIYNVIYNGKNSARVYKDLASVDEYLTLLKGNKHSGAKHIKIRHTTDTKAEGHLTKTEITKLGESLREFLKNNEPIKEGNALIYEWFNKDGVKFRMVSGANLGKAKSESVLTSADEGIITFYSNRNLKDGKIFEFKNPKVAAGYSEANNKAFLTKADKEKRGIYNVTHNGKIATYLKDADAAEAAVRYARGDKKGGAAHIKIRHLTDPNKEGFVTDSELLNIGEKMRAFIKKHGEPFIDKNGSKIYEWEQNGAKFRVVVRGASHNARITSTSDNASGIITFYSNRNLKDGKIFEFKNPKVAAGYSDKAYLTAAQKNKITAEDIGDLEVLSRNTLKEANIYQLDIKGIHDGFKYPQRAAFAYDRVYIDPNISTAQISGNDIILPKKYDAQMVADAFNKLIKRGRIIIEADVRNIAEKFDLPKGKASDLLEWHKDSHKLTKDKDGTPRIFYHGTNTTGLQEFKGEFDKTGWGFWFSSRKGSTKEYGNKRLEVFLNIKKPFVNDGAIKDEALLKDLKDFVLKDNPRAFDGKEDLIKNFIFKFNHSKDKTKIIKDILKKHGYDGIITRPIYDLNAPKNEWHAIVFDSSQIKEVSNHGADIGGGLKYFNEDSPNIYYLKNNPKKKELKQMLARQSGEVKGAFKRDDLGAIDIVWGEVKGKGAKASGYGLAKIIEKHGDDFRGFAGETVAQKVLNGIAYLIQNGKLTTSHNKTRAIIQTDDFIGVIGLKYKSEDKKWVLTAYKSAPKGAGSHTDRLNASTLSVDRTSGGMSNYTTKIAEDRVFLRSSGEADSAKTLSERWEDGVDSVFDMSYKAYAKIVRAASDKLPQKGKDMLLRAAALQDRAGAINEMVLTHKENISKINASANRVFKEFNKLSEIDRKTLFKALDEGEGAVFSETGGELHKVYKKMRGMIDTNTKELIRYGALDEKNAMQNYIKHFYTQFNETKGALSGTLGKFFARKNLSAEQKEKLGLIDDAAIAVAATLKEQQSQIAKAKLLKNLADNYGISEDDFAKIVSGDGASKFIHDYRKRLNKVLSRFDKKPIKLARASSRREIEKEMDITPVKEFGENYSEMTMGGSVALDALFKAKKGQVAHAFYKDELGFIDAVWGDDRLGLAKISNKHAADFANFEGADSSEKIANGIAKIINNGKVVDKDGVMSVWYKNKDEYFVAGLSKGWEGEGANQWIITSYKKTKGEIPKEIKGDGANLSAYSTEFNPPLTSGDEPLKGDYITKLIKDYGGADNFEKISDELAGGGIKKYGALAGKFVPKEVSEALRDMGAMRQIQHELLGDFGEALIKGVDHIKVNLTVKNQFAHLYNTATNVVLAFLHGDLGAVSSLAKTMLTNKKEFARLNQLANDLGMDSALDDMSLKAAFKEFGKEAVLDSNGEVNTGRFLRVLGNTASDISQNVVKKEHFSSNEAVKIASELKNIAGEKLPPQISKDEFLKLFKEIENVERFTDKIASKNREAQLNLIKPTLENSDLIINAAEKNARGEIVERQKYIKKFSDGKDIYFILSTEKEGRELVTAFKINNLNTTLKREISVATEYQKRWQPLSGSSGLPAKGDKAQPSKSDYIIKPLKSVAKNLYMSEGTITGDFMRSAYSWEDKFFKLARFKKNLDKGMEESAAFRDANAAYVDYRTHYNPSIKVLDKLGIMPFMHYAVKSTPLMLKASLKSPIKSAMLIALSGYGAKCDPDLYCYLAAYRLGLNRL